MKTVFLMLFFITSMLLGTDVALAGDVSCQTDLMKPKMNAAVIIDEVNKPAKLTVAETQQRLRELHEEETAELQQQSKSPKQRESSNNNQTTAKKTVKKTSPLGGIFDILLPSKLRNPAK